jgi:hypothetical protein
VSLKKSVEGIARGKSEKATQLRLCEPSASEFFKRQCLKSASRKVTASGAKPLSDIIRNFDGQLHRPTLTTRQATGKEPAVHFPVH